MRYPLLFVLTMCCLPPCLGQKPMSYPACRKTAMAQTEMDECADAEATQVDNKLKSVYAKLLAKESADPLAVSKIKTAEAAWIKYRDAYIDAMYPAPDKQTAYGTIYPMEVLTLRAKLTREHIAALNDILNPVE